MTYIGRKPCPGCPGLRPPYPPCCCIGVPDYGTQPLPSSPLWQPTYTPRPVTVPSIPVTVPSIPVTVPSIPVTPAPRGCVCPPTSEQTCQSPVCPRKPAPSPPGSDEAKAPLTMRVDSDPRVSQSAAFMTPAESNLQKVQIPTSTIPEGFIPWHGGECPVQGCRVSVAFRRGGAPTDWFNPGAFRWSHEGNRPDDIIAYRIHKPADFRLEAGKYYIDARGKRTRLVRGLTAPMPGLFHDGGARVWKADGTAQSAGDPDLLALSSNQENSHDR